MARLSRLRIPEVEVIMTVARFKGTGPVARYWLANCEGFEVKGGARGVVEELIRDADPHVTTRLVVRTRARRRTIVSAGAVAAVVPAERTLVVAPAKKERRARRSLRLPSVGPAVERTASLAATVGPPARSAAAAAGARTASLAAGLRPLGRSAVAAAAALGPPLRSLALALTHAAERNGRRAAVVVAGSLRRLAGDVLATSAMLVRSRRSRPRR